MDPLERINLDVMYGRTEVQRWQRGHPEASDFRQVRIGHTSTGQWWTAGNIRGLRGGQAWLCHDRVHARQVAAEAMAGGGWVSAG